MMDTTSQMHASPDHRPAARATGVAISVRRPSLLRQLVLTARSALGLAIEVADAVAERVRDTVGAPRP